MKDSGRAAGRVDAVGFALLAAAACAALVLRFRDPAANWCVGIIPAAAAAYAWWRRRPYRGAASFLVLAYFMRHVPVPQLGLLLGLPLILYLIAARFLPAFRREPRPFPRGSLSPRVWGAAAAIAALSILGLVAWYAWARPDVGRYTAMMPPWPPPALLALGVGWACANALVEEGIYRGVMWEAWGTCWPRPAAIIVMQAVVFGGAHWAGIPSGAAGVVLATLYGGALGVLRYYARGLAAAIVAHVVADVVIFTLVLYISGML